MSPTSQIEDLIEDDILYGRPVHDQIDEMIKIEEQRKEQKRLRAAEWERKQIEKLEKQRAKSIKDAWLKEQGKGKRRWFGLWG